MISLKYRTLNSMLRKWKYVQSLIVEVINWWSQTPCQTKSLPDDGLSSGSQHNRTPITQRYWQVAFWIFGLIWRTQEGSINLLCWEIQSIVSKIAERKLGSSIANLERTKLAPRGETRHHRWNSETGCSTTSTGQVYSVIRIIIMTVLFFIKDSHITF